MKSLFPGRNCINGWLSVLKFMGWFYCYLLLFIASVWTCTDTHLNDLAQWKCVSLEAKTDFFICADDSNMVILLTHNKDWWETHARPLKQAPQFIAVMFLELTFTKPYQQQQSNKRTWHCSNNTCWFISYENKHMSLWTFYRSENTM